MNRFLPISLLLLALTLSSCGMRSTPEAKDGALDLGSWDFSQKATHTLNGEWEFYWSQLLFPSDFNSQAEVKPTGMFHIPGKWNDFQFENKKPNGQGFATFRLRINGLPPDTRFGFKIMDMGTAYRLWANGVLVMENGTVGKNMETSVPQYYPETGHFQSKKGVNEVVLQVSNFHHRKGGVWKTIVFGLSSEIKLTKNRTMAMELFLFAALITMGLYHLGLHAIRPKDKSTFYFGLVCLIVGIRATIVGDRFFIHVFPHFSWEWFQKIEYLIFYLAVTLFCFFLNCLLDEISLWVARLTLVLASVFSIQVLITPIRIYSHSVIYWEIYVLLLCGYVLISLLKAIKAKKETAVWVLLGFSFIVITLFYDILGANELVYPIYLTPVGLFLFVFAQSFMLSVRYSNAFQSVESLSVELSNSVEELEEAENRYRSLFENAMEGIFLATPTGLIISANPAILKMLEYKSIDDFQSHVYGFESRLFASITQRDEIASQLEESGFVRGYEIDLYRKSGGMIRVSINIHAVKNNENEIKYIEAVLTDVTHLRLIEKYRIAKESAELTNQVKSEFLANISHELRTPMHAILGFAKLGDSRINELSRKKLGEYFKEITQSGSSLLALLDDLLDLSKLESKKIEYQFKQEKLAEAAQVVINEFAARLEERKIELRFEAPVFDDTATFDFAKIVQVIRNLMSNAIKFTPLNGLILVAINKSSEGFLTFSLADNGVGVPDGEFESIFDKFAQSSRTNKGNGGTGLGLAICRQIMTDHNGKIWVESNQPSGSIFKLTLPQKQRDSN